MTLLTRWEPFRELSAMQDRMNRMNRLFRDSNSPESPEEALTTTGFAPPVDIYEDEHTIMRWSRSWYLRREPAACCPIHTCTKYALPHCLREWEHSPPEWPRSLPGAPQSGLLWADIPWSC